MRWKARELARLIVVVSSLLVITIPLSAEPPADISYQGQLLDADGNPLGGPVDLQIRIYESFSPSPGEVALFVEDHAGMEITTGGVFSITLGGGSTVSGTLGPETFEGSNRYLEVHVNGERLSPRQPFNSVPYAFHASRAENAGAALRVFDGSGNDIGLFMDLDRTMPDTQIDVYLEEMRAAVTLGIDTGNLWAWWINVHFTLPGCQGEAYIRDGSAPRLFEVRETGRYFVIRPPLVDVEIQSTLESSGCTDGSSPMSNVYPAEEVTSSMPFSLPLPTPLYFGSAP